MTLWPTEEIIPAANSWSRSFEMYCKPRHFRDTIPQWRTLTISRGAERPVRTANTTVGTHGDYDHAHTE